MKERNVRHALDLTGAEQDELARLRLPATDRKLAPKFGIWLRTWYGPGSDAAFASLHESLRYNEPTLVLDDASLYNFGEEWERIFERMPQLVHTYFSAQKYSEKKQKALKEALEMEEDGRVADPDFGYDPDEDAIPWEEHSANYQWACITGYVLIIDKTTLSSGDGPEDKSEDSGTILVMWYDDRGRGVRSGRERPDQVVDYAGLLMESFVRDHPIWTNASVGEDYEREAVVGTAEDTLRAPYVVV